MSEEKVGAYLRKVREEHGLELKQLAESIRLSPEVVENIEENNWDFFPIEAYLRSYIISICEKFSLDSAVVLKKFDSEINSEYAINQNKISDLTGINQKPSSGNSKVVIGVIAAVLVLMFIVANFLNRKEAKMDSASNLPEVELVLQEEADDSTDVSDTLSSDADNASAPENAAVNAQKKDSVPALQPIASSGANPAANAPSAKSSTAMDTLKFECTALQPPNHTCSVKLKGLDENTRYFTNNSYRYITHGDTAHITVTVPERTKIFINGVLVKNAARDKVLLFYKGEVVKK